MSNDNEHAMMLPVAQQPVSFAFAEQNAVCTENSFRCTATNGTCASYRCTIAFQTNLAPYPLQLHADCFSGEGLS